ncbi:MAG: PEP-CTERM sorting domain-containing protein [Planctomyces sp.]
MMRVIQLAVACVAVLVASAGQVQAGLITNGGFETGDFTGWTATSNVGGGIIELVPWTVSGSGGGFFLNSSPNSGGFSAYNGFDGGAGLEYRLYQDVSIDASSATLTTNHRIVYLGDGTSSLDRIFEINVLDTSDVLLANLYTSSTTMNGAPFTDTGWLNNSLDLSSFIGSTIRLEFFQSIPESYTGPAHLELDDISLSAAVPEPSSLTLFGIGACVAGIGACRRRRRQKQQQATS